MGNTRETSIVLDLTYGARIWQEDDAWLVQFRDFDNVVTYGESLEEAAFNAQEALDGVLASMVEHDQEIPLPSPPEDGDVPVTVSPEIAGPVLLHILRTKCGRSMAEVATAMGKPYQAYQRIEKSGTNLTLKTLKQAAAALGATVEIRLHKLDDCNHQPA